MGAVDEKLLFLALSTVLNRVIRNLFAKLTLTLHGADKSSCKLLHQKFYCNSRIKFYIGGGHQIMENFKLL